MKQRFYVDGTKQEPDYKNAVYLRGINPPVWVAINDTMAKEAIVRLNSMDALGRLRGWEYEEDNSFGIPTKRPGWTVDDLVGAVRGGEPTREQIKKAGTLLQAIAVVANNKMKR